MLSFGTLSGTDSRSPPRLRVLSPGMTVIHSSGESTERCVNCGSEEVRTVACSIGRGEAVPVTYQCQRCGSMPSESMEGHFGDHEVPDRVDHERGWKRRETHVSRQRVTAQHNTALPRSPTHLQGPGLLAPSKVGRCAAGLSLTVCLFPLRSALTVVCTPRWVVLFPHCPFENLVSLWSAY